jgi:flagellar hook protein FlgE
MSVYGFFQPSVLGMESQSHALGAISANIANATTPAYKRTDVHFTTLLSRTVASSPATGPSLSTQSDLGGVRPTDYVRISLQGAISSTDRDLDVALNGSGFFVLGSEASGAGETYYGRNGRFSIQPVNDATGGPSVGGYLVDGNGYYVLGWAADTDGTIFSGGALAPILIDPDAIVSDGQATTQATLTANLPANDAPGDVETYTIDIFDSAGNRRNLQLSFTKDAAANTWNLAVDAGSGNTVVVTPSASGLEPDPLLFASTGTLVSPLEYSFSATFSDGSTSTFDLDVSAFTQFGGPMSVLEYQHDGLPPGDLAAIEFNSIGDLIGIFDNGTTRPLYRLAIADFANPDGLAAVSGSVFVATEESGTAALASAGESGRGIVTPSAIELSNVELADEFTRMIMTQSAYNFAAKAFQTADDMTVVARDLKS